MDRIEQLKLDLKKYNGLLLDVLNSMPYIKGTKESKQTKNDLEKIIRDIKFRIEFEDARSKRETRYNINRIIVSSQQPRAIQQRPVRQIQRKVIRK